MTNSTMMTASLQEKCAVLYQLRSEIQMERNEIIGQVIRKMEINKAYTIHELFELADHRISEMMLSGSFHSLATMPPVYSKDYGSSLRRSFCRNKIVKGMPREKHTYFIECDENGAPIPGGKQTVRIARNTTYIRQE